MRERSDADGLYLLPPDEFIAARTALAKRLRAGGDRAEAQRVIKLRRPSVSAWALNQVARTDPSLIVDLLDTGATLRQAMADAMAGDASGLRRAEARERAAVDAILSRAAADGGLLPEPHRRRMVATLRAAVLDQGVATSLRNATLDSDHEAPPFEFGAGPEAAATVKKRLPKPSRPDDAAAARERARQAEIARLRAEADRLARQAERLDRDAVAAERRAGDLRAKARDAADAADAAGEKLALAQASGPPG